MRQQGLRGLGAGDEDLRARGDQIVDDTGLVGAIEFGSEVVERDDGPFAGEARVEPRLARAAGEGGELCLARATGRRGPGRR